MDNDLLQCKDPFPITIVDVCRILAGWKNKYSVRDNKMTNAYDGVAFSMTLKENDKKNEKKEIDVVMENDDVEDDDMDYDNKSEQGEESTDEEEEETDNDNTTVSNNDDY